MLKIWWERLTYRSNNFNEPQTVETQRVSYLNISNSWKLKTKKIIESIHQINQMIQLMADFSLEKIEEKKDIEITYLNCWRKKKNPTDYEFSYSVKLGFRNVCEIKVFPINNKEFKTNTSSLQEILKEGHQVERKCYQCIVKSIGRNEKH